MYIYHRQDSQDVCEGCMRRDVVCAMMSESRGRKAHATRQGLRLMRVADRVLRCFRYMMLYVFLSCLQEMKEA